MKVIITILFVLLTTVIFGAIDDDFRTKEIDINVSETPITAFLQMIAKQSGMELSLGSGISGTVTGSFKKTTAYDALFKVARENGLKFGINRGTLYVAKKEEEEQSETENMPRAKKSSSGNGIEFIPIKYMEAKTVPEKVRPLLQPGEQLLVDDASNSMTLVGSRRSADAIRSYLENIDTPPIQIIIEAQIVEMTKNKSRELGVSFGDLDNTDLTIPAGAKGTGSIKSSRSLAPNMSMGIKMGSIAGNVLQARIDAAEQSGEAKVISRPKVATLSNIPATINSGITFNVKTAVTNESGITTAGAIQSIKAGLTLSVTPNKVGDNQVKLKIDLTNSEPNNSTAVDGIPGINENSAKATIIIGSGETAVMAGLIKQTSGTTRNGVPGFSSIPFLGWLFKSQLEKAESTELMILITPKIIQAELPNMQTARLEKVLDINNRESK